MYRYYLFLYYSYYPHGGMNDCVLKTNDFNDLKRFVLEDDSDCENIQYYDSVTDKTFRGYLYFNNLVWEEC